MESIKPGFATSNLPTFDQAYVAQAGRRDLNCSHLQSETAAVVTNPRIHAIMVKFLLMIGFLLVAVFLIFSVCSAGQFKVSRVTDGDTITVRDGGVEKTIRLVGIDAPEISHKKSEPSQPFAQAATKYLAGLVLNKVVEIKEYGQDRYGRTLGVVFLGGKNVNLEMVKAGYAEVYRGTPAAGFDSAPYWKAEEESESGKEGNVGSGGEIRESQGMEER